MSSLVRVLDHGSIRELKLSRAPVNAFNTPLCIALLDALSQAFSDDVQGIVLSGGEGIFSAGMDVPYLLAHGNDQQALLNSWNVFSI
jgi:enoyl-CoA hydratase/carnithine racemase